MAPRGLVGHALHVHKFDLDGNATVYVSRPRRGRSIVAVCHGNIGNESVAERPVLVRMQSSCLYQILGSPDCDCGEQLEKAKELIASAGSGVILYLEGVGMEMIGRRGPIRSTLHDVMSVYFDRHMYHAMALILRDHLGIRRARLLTNNPEKVRAMRRAGIAIEREPLQVATTRWNRSHLESKRRLGHLLNNDIEPEIN